MNSELLLKEANEEIITLKTKIEEQENEISTLKSDKESLEEDIEDLRAENKSLQEELDEFEDKVNEETSDLAGQISDLEDEVKELENRPLKPNNLQEEMKTKVLMRLNHNLTLEKLENVEKFVKGFFKDSKEHYVEDVF